jgi:hypothetical protein
MSIEPPTVENLKSLYESELYQNLLSEFAERTRVLGTVQANCKLDDREQDLTILLSNLAYCQRRYHILGIAFEEVLREFEKNRDNFLEYQIAVTAENYTHFDDFPKIDKTYFIERFCEFYILQTGDFKRLLAYLAVFDKMANAKNQRYAERITKIYRNFEKNIGRMPAANDRFGATAAGSADLKGSA